MVKGKQMKSKSNNLFPMKIFLSVCGIGLSCVLAFALYAAPQEKPKASETSQPKQEAFDTPKQAADALIQALAQFDVPRLEQIFGSENADFIVTKDQVQDKEKATWFATKAHDETSITKDPKNPNRAVLSVGKDDWPLPIPIVKRSGKWYFDAKAGHQEILDRRIGANELDAIAICRGYVEAQQEYALEVHDNSGINQYAQRIISQPGKRDGLAWKNADGSWGGPVGEDIAKALEEGYTSKSKPYHGYYFKILKGQGPAAPLGEMNFLVEGVMIGGFALVAVPADYRVTGVETFIVSYEGIVYQKDLGPDSLNIVKNMELYNPDKTWHRTDDQW